MNFITFILLRNLQSKWKSNEDISSQYFIVPPLEIYCFVCTNVFEKPQFSSVQFSRSVVSDFLLGLEHARLPCPSSTPRVCSNSCLWSQWFHPTISSSVIPFSFSLQSFPASGSLTVSQFLTSGGQIIGVSTLSSVLPMDIQDWFPLGLTGWLSLPSKGLSRVLSNTTVQKH